MAKFGQGSGAVMTAIGSTVGLVLALYAYNEILDAVWGLVNNTTYFGTAVTFVSNLLPVIGILAAFEIIYRALKASKLI